MREIAESGSCPILILELLLSYWIYYQNKINHQGKNLICFLSVRDKHQISTYKNVTF